MQAEGLRNNPTWRKCGFYVPLTWLPTEISGFLVQVFEGNEREEELDKLRALMEENWRDAHEFQDQVEAQKEVDKRMELPDLDIDEVSCTFMIRLANPRLRESRNLGSDIVDLLKQS